MHDDNVCVIIPVFNAGNYLDRCLRSLDGQTYRDFQILLINDCSTDKSLDNIKQTPIAIRILCNPRRLGPEKSRNRAILSSRARYLAFLDSDTVVDKNWLEEMLEIIEKDASIGMCASRILTFSSPHNIESAGHDLYYDFSAMHRGEGEEGDRFVANVEVFGVCLAGALIRRQVFDTVGMFDEDYGFNFGDDEWSWRARLAGYKCMYVSRAIVYHCRLNTQTISEKFLFAWEKNRLFSIIKYYSVYMAASSIVYTIRRYISTLSSGNYSKKTDLSLLHCIIIVIAAWGYALFRSTCFLKKRKSIAPLQAVHDDMDTWLKRKWQTR